LFEGGIVIVSTNQEAVKKVIAMAGGNQRVISILREIKLQCGAEPEDEFLERRD
jgi:hypothetical protein